MGLGRSALAVGPPSPPPATRGQRRNTAYLKPILSDTGRIWRYDPVIGGEPRLVSASVSASASAEPPKRTRSPSESSTEPLSVFIQIRPSRNRAWSAFEGQDGFGFVWTNCENASSVIRNVPSRPASPEPVESVRASGPASRVVGEASGSSSSEQAPKMRAHTTSSRRCFTAAQLSRGVRSKMASSRSRRCSRLARPTPSSHSHRARPSSRSHRRRRAFTSHRRRPCSRTCD